MAKGPDDFADDWVDAKIAVSGYILSASVAYVSPLQVLGKLMGQMFEIRSCLWEYLGSFIVVGGGYFWFMFLEFFVVWDWGIGVQLVFGRSLHTRRSTRLNIHFKSIIKFNWSYKRLFSVSFTWFSWVKIFDVDKNRHSLISLDHYRARCMTFLATPTDLSAGSCKFMQT